MVPQEAPNVLILLGVFGELFQCICEKFRVNIKI